MTKTRIQKAIAILITFVMICTLFNLISQNTVTVSAGWSSVAELENYALANWTKPIQASYADINTGSRYFGANRSGTTRKHAANDYVCAVGTPVYAMTGGYVEEFSSNFYGGTQAISVKNDDGSVARYCEIKTSFRSGDRVEKGQQIGTVIANNSGGGHMLHLEMYLGTASGSLTNTSNSTYWYVSYKNYCRRQDLIDPSFTQKLGNGNPNPNLDIVTPTISTDKSSYIVGDTVNVSWTASPSNSNLEHYWITIDAPSGTIVNETMALNTSFSFVASEIGDYTITTCATPHNSPDGSGSLTDTKTVNVASATWYGSLTPVNLGETFDSVLLAKDPWITIRALGAEEDYNVILQSEQGVTSEMWRFTRQDDGSYVITNFATGRVLDAYGLGTTDFTNVFTDVYNGGGNQKWFIYEKNGGYVLRPAYSDMVLDVDHAIFESGTNIEIHAQNDSTAQNFALYYENASYGTPKTGNIIAEADGCTVTLNIDKGFYIDQQNIYRSTDKENWLLINSGTNEDNLTVTDAKLNENTTYYYKATYSNRYYNIESDIVSVTTGHKPVIGDCNNDGSFTVADVVMLQKWLLNDETKLTNWKAADLYADDILNVFDLSLMKQLILD